MFCYKFVINIDLLGKLVDICIIYVLLIIIFLLLKCMCIGVGMICLGLVFFMFVVLLIWNFFFGVNGERMFFWKCRYCFGWFKGFIKSNVLFFVNKIFLVCIFLVVMY